MAVEFFEAKRWPDGPACLLGAACAVLGMSGAILVAAAAGAIAFCARSLAWFLPRRGALTETEIAPIN